MILNFNRRLMMVGIAATLLIGGTYDGFAAPKKGSVVLTADKAKTAGKVRIKKKQAESWQKGGELSWSFKAPVAIKDGFLTIKYAAANNETLSYEIDGVKETVTLKATDSMATFRTAVIKKIDLSAGAHTLKFSNPEAGEFIIFQTVEISANEPPPFSLEYPAVYAKKATWAESMTALRKAYGDPKMEEARMYFGKKLNLFLSTKDGKAFWTDFPVETDWFLQDNQVHGTWGAGVYDARGDYKNYLNQNRDNSLEKQLIEHVLTEVKDPALQKEFDALKAKNPSPNDPAWLTLYEKICHVRRTARLAPLLAKTDKLIYATHQNMGIIYLETETQGCPDGSQLRVIDLTPEANGQFLKDEVLFDSNNGIVRDPEVTYDGKKLLFAWRKTNVGAKTNGNLAPATGNYKIYEMDLATRDIRALTDDSTYSADFEPCQLPNGDIMFSSARCVQEVTCGWGDGSNLYLMDKDGKFARRVGFDQTQTAFPHVLNDGRVIYTRRDYNDRGQSYAHALFVMNPDGTTQTEYYGNNSSAPTSIQHTRPIPGTRKTMGIAGGYHTSQGGKLVTIDPSKGTQNYEGLDFYNWTPTPPEKVSQENYCRVGEQFSYPFPFSETNLVVSMSPIGGYLTKPDGNLNKDIEQGLMLYNLYHLTTDGRRELLAANPTLSCTQAVPVMEREKPMVRASAVDYNKDNSTCYVQDVYYGPGAEGIERGSIKKLRVVKLYYKHVTIGAGGWSPPRNEVGPGRKYSGYGWHSVLPTGVGSASFDAKEILGEVDVHEDGSVMFDIPARTPVYFQLIDENGLVAQTMRSWATLMPGERFSCVGCHEENDSAPLPNAMKTIAMQSKPQQLQKPASLTGKPFNYFERVQPIWDKHCVSCHAPGKKAAKIDLSATLVSDNTKDTWASSTRRKFNQSYLTLLQVKWDTSNTKTKGPRLDEGRSNEWVNYYTRMAPMELLPPYYAGSTQSGLIKLLQRGHGKTNLTKEEIGTVAAWIDLNVPFVGEYDAMNIWDEKTVERYNSKLDMRKKQEAIEAENIKAFIEAGQP